MFEKAKEFMPGGVNSPVRAFKSVELDPIFVKSAKGSKIKDINNNEYIDYIQSWGALILGHSHEVVINAINEQSQKGTSYGLCHPLEVEMAQILVENIPSIEMVRMVNSGTEAVMSAIRLARAYTKRDFIVKFEGCYHGHSDSLLVKAGSGALTFGTPNSEGVTKEFVSKTIVAKYNDVQNINEIFENFGDKIACVIVEPIAGNMGVVPPKPNFLLTLRKLTKKYNSILIFDEVITGFRVSQNGAQGLFNVIPDLTTLGKVIGGGLPVGAFGGKKEIMQLISPQGPVYQAGTLSGNPLTLAAGVSTLKFILNNKNFYKKLDELAKTLEEGLLYALKDFNIKVNRVGSMISFFFNGSSVDTYEKVISSDVNMYKKLFKYFLSYGILLPPSPFESLFISYAHTNEDIQQTIDIAMKFSKNLKEGKV
ncbi:glutamate-1-semialdehyde aminotransferase [Thermosipho melanesiensis]|uniref:Glutamate-1-semialdehyde 2,1-aminomutase n=2 Tax=Thermosipho melanesiensis TaxID=46541 RepID=GSA_THEM4|nr:glutamate-1-semialdehyde 2,1-aminomutase [Thermosipho melanesiensis]A6LKX4.1 RecName: Full=Glutamate-1-semialdehyde 2,1-aminomutase; Short=GSA; AltName: Full=Glutamate-1-semialdehyde aminotransferase; Short=GSA-AT [Thermosipho melanesiensis BI429]ABR30575.1 glutamate-1-semialdehyde-2,1-aminomutase [Thermosipho melanesiensis BI429]APT73723.1 glutamate-1-semialdehyde aminotransferase [Thermosipho melanesiensis]OOC35661.1 glutamate-1-semialdehyde aminotransferase [Thermosipho melanesiensis]OOC